MSDTKDEKSQHELQVVSAPDAVAKKAETPTKSNSKGDSTVGLPYRGKVRKTFSQKPAEVTRKWYVLDASKTSMGRLATVAASLLLGKGKVTVTSHVDGGDYVIVINAGKMVVTGGKEKKKIYYNYSGYPSGLRKRSLDEVPADEAIYKAIRGMLPSNKLRPGRLERLKIYEGEEHSHHAQKPEVYELGSKK